MSSPKEPKNYERDQQTCLCTHQERVLFGFFVVFLNCWAGEQHAKAIDKITPVRGNQLKT